MTGRASKYLDILSHRDHFWYKKLDGPFSFIFSVYLCNIRLFHHDLQEILF